jgi:hypothetical protein
MKATRREFLLDGLKASLILPHLGPNMLLARAGQPKFFLNVIYADGLAHHYLFDSRPLEFTAAGVFVNNGLNSTITMRNPAMVEVRGIGPEALQDRMGRSMVAHPLTRSLLKDHQNDMIIINGVHNKAAVFDDGHDTNRSSVLNAGGGAFFFQKMADLKNNNRLVYEERNTPGVQGIATLTNPEVFSSVMSLVKDASLFRPELVELANRQREIYECYSGARSCEAHVLDSLKPASGELLSSIDNAKELYSQLNAGDAAANRQNNRAQLGRFSVADLMRMVRYAFEFGISPYVTLVIAAGSDSHQRAESIEDPDRYAQIVNHIHQIMTFLKAESFSGQSNKMADDVLMMIGSEFNRTTVMNRSGFTNVLDSGTDHNAYGNSLILFGGGVKGLQILGETDGKTLSAQPANTNWQDSKFGTQSSTQIVFDEFFRKNFRHDFIRQSDFDRRVIGRPFDFTQQKPLPEGKMGSIITMQHVHNSILHHFGIAEQQLLPVPDGQLARNELLRFT